MVFVRIINYYAWVRCNRAYNWKDKEAVHRKKLKFKYLIFSLIYNNVNNNANRNTFWRELYQYYQHEYEMFKNLKLLPLLFLIVPLNKSAAVNSQRKT